MHFAVVPEAAGIEVGEAADDAAAVDFGGGEYCCSGRQIAAAWREVDAGVRRDDDAVDAVGVGVAGMPWVARTCAAAESADVDKRLEL